MKTANAGVALGHGMNGVSDKPTRRWEPWPIGIAAFLGVFVACVGSFITFAVRQQFDLVRPDYYEEEIRYQVQYNRLERARALGDEVHLAASPGSGLLTFRIPARQVDGLAAGTIQLYRPSDAGKDRIIPMRPDAKGSQEVRLDGLDEGLWRIKVRWTADGLEYAVDGSVVIPKRG